MAIFNYFFFIFHFGEFNYSHIGYQTVGLNQNHLRLSMNFIEDSLTLSIPKKTWESNQT